MLQVWMCSSRSVWTSGIIWWIRQVCKLLPLRYLPRLKQSLKYSNPLDPLSNVANAVLRYYKGHRDPKGRVLPGISNPCTALIEIVPERAQRAEKAKSKGGIAGKEQYSLLQYLQPTTGDVPSRLPSEPVHVERTTVDVPPPPPHVEPSNVAWWRSSVVAKIERLSHKPVSLPKFVSSSG